MLGDQGLQSLMDNFTTAIDTGISNIEAKPVIMFFDGHCLMIPEEEDCIIHTYLEAVESYES